MKTNRPTSPIRSRIQSRLKMLTSNDPPHMDLHDHISKSKWCSLSQYARERLGVGEGTFRSWLVGIVSTPPEAIDKIEADFPSVSLKFITRRRGAK